MHMRVFAPFRGTATIKGVRKNARTALLTFNKAAVISAFVLTNNVLAKLARLFEANLMDATIF